MAAQSPPFALQNASHGAAVFRQAVFSAFPEGGTLSAAELVVAAQSTPNMSVQVSAGRAWIPGTQVANASGQSWSTQAAYFGLNDAPISVTITAANATNPRIDVIYVAATDSFYSGSTNTTVIGVVTGTAAASPVAPAIPNNALALGQVAVAANATSVVSGNISLTTGLWTTALGGINPTTLADATPGLRVGQYRDIPLKGLQRWDGILWSPPNGDTGWVSFGAVGAALGTGFTVGSEGAHYRVTGGICYFQIHVIRATGSTVGTVLTFPSTARPVWTHWWMWESAGLNMGEAKIDSTGTLGFNYSAGTGLGCVVAGCFPVGS